MQIIQRSMLLRSCLPAFKFYVLLSLFLGLVYTLVLLVSASLFFPHLSNGSLLYCQKKICGSALLAQEFTQDKYFWARPSLTQYEMDWVAAEKFYPLGAKEWRKLEQQQKILFARTDLPAELIQPSASQLDPHLSPAAIALQVARVMQARHMSKMALETMVKKYTEGPFLGFFGQERVNVVRLNHALDKWSDEVHEKTP